MHVDEPREGEVLVVRPGEASSHWQPVPANGFVEVLVGPGRVPMDTPFGFGTQTVPPGCHVREHRHERNDEVIYVLHGHGRAVIDGADVPLMPIPPALPDDARSPSGSRSTTVTAWPSARR